MFLNCKSQNQITDSQLLQKITNFACFMHIFFSLYFTEKIFTQKTFKTMTHYDYLIHDEIEVIGLISKPQYNGCTGKIIGAKNDKDRYPILINLPNNKSIHTTKKLLIIPILFNTLHLSRKASTKTPHSNLDSTACCFIFIAKSVLPQDLQKIQPFHQCIAVLSGNTTGHRYHASF